MQCRGNSRLNEISSRKIGARGAKRRASTLAAVVVALLAAMALPSVARATDYYWDADGAVTTTIGGTGTWDTGSLLWHSGNATGTLSIWPNDNPSLHKAVLAGTAGTVTIADNTTVYVNVLQVDVAGYTIAGADADSVLYFSGDNATITNSTTENKDLTINATINTGSGVTLALNEASCTLNNSAGNQLRAVARSMWLAVRNTPTVAASSSTTPNRTSLVALP